MTRPVIGFAGLTHLGLNSAVASAARGFSVIGYHDDADAVAQLRRGEPTVSEPDLAELMAAHADRLTYTDDVSALQVCDLVYISVDVPTDDNGRSDLGPVDAMVDAVVRHMAADAILVILCQVPPGYSRALKVAPERLYYQVETLIFGRAIERALNPERFILGCAEPARPLAPMLERYLDAFDCPILKMRYESAELAKISINMCLVASVSVANTMAELCESIGANWWEIVPALRLDRRIGEFAYISPGLGISGGNLERDLATVIRLAEAGGTDHGVVDAWIANSKHRKDWPWKMLCGLLPAGERVPKVGVLGLAYKENTHSIKNAPSLRLIEHLDGYETVAFDPAVSSLPPSVAVRRTATALEVFDGADAVAVMTPWPEFRSIAPDQIAARMKGRLILDPYRVLNASDLRDLGFLVVHLGAPFEG